MKVHRKRWLNNAARLKEARHVSWLHKQGLTRRSTLGEVMAAGIYAMTNRKGFMRRIIDLMEAEDKAGVQSSKLPILKMEVQKIGPPIRPTDWHLEAGDGYYAVVPGPHPSGL